MKFNLTIVIEINICSYFYYRYQCLTKRHGILSNRDQVLSVISELNIPTSEWQVGKTKVFLRSVVHEPLEDARKQVIGTKAKIIQTVWRKYKAQQRYKKILQATLAIQHAYKGWKLRIDFLRKRRACVVIQSHLRGVFAREVYISKLWVIIKEVLCLFVNNLGRSCIARNAKSGRRNA